MGKEFFDAFLVGAMAISAVMALVWLMRIRSKGLSGWLMAGAFLSFGGWCAVLRFDAGQPWSWVFAIALGVLLAADFAARAVRDARDRDLHP